MELNNLNDFFKGWIIGNFTPTLFNTDDFEISIKRYKEGELEQSHKHIVATEWTVIVSGKVKMNDNIFNENDIITVSKGEYTDFLCLTDVITVVIKVPCSKNDKYLKNDN